MGEPRLRSNKHLGLNLIKTHREQHPPFMSACVIVVHRERCDQNKQFSLGEEIRQSHCAACTNYTLLWANNPGDLSGIHSITLIRNAFHLYCFPVPAKVSLSERRTCWIINVRCWWNSCTLCDFKRPIKQSAAAAASDDYLQDVKTRVSAFILSTLCLWFIFTMHKDPHLSSNFPVVPHLIISATYAI